MSYYSDAFPHHKPIAVPNAAGAATLDVHVVIPTDWDPFWDAIDASGEQLRVTAGDGVTLLNYEVDDGAGGAFNKTTRSGRLILDGVAAPTIVDSQLCLWLYYGSTGEADGSTATTIASPVDGKIERAAPGWRLAQVGRSDLVGGQPRIVVKKQPDDEDYLWIDLAPLLELRQQEYARRRTYEEVAAVTVAAITAVGGDPYPAMVDPELVRYVVTGRGTTRRVWVRVPIAAGVDAANYTVQVTVLTRIPSKVALHRTFVVPIGVRVLEITEPVP